MTAELMSKEIDQIRNALIDFDSDKTMSVLMQQLSNGTDQLAEKVFLVLRHIVDVRIASCCKTEKLLGRIRVVLRKSQPKPDFRKLFDCLFAIIVGNMNERPLSSHIALSILIENADCFQHRKVTKFLTEFLKKCANNLQANTIVIKRALDLLNKLRKPSTRLINPLMRLLAQPTLNESARYAISTKLGEMAIDRKNRYCARFVFENLGPRATDLWVEDRFRESYIDNVKLLLDRKCSVDDLGGLFVEICQLALNDQSQVVRLKAVEVLGHREFGLKLDHWHLLQSIEKECLAYNTQFFKKVSAGVMMVDNPTRIHRLATYPNIPLIPLNSTGVFVACSEHEHPSIRMAVTSSLTSLTTIICQNRIDSESKFVESSVNHLVNMMTDEKDEVRLAAMDALVQILRLTNCSNIVRLKRNQILILAFNAEDHNKRIRRTSRKLYTHCLLRDRDSLRILIQSIFGCLESNQSEFSKCMECLATVARNNARLLFDMQAGLMGDQQMSNLDNPLYACTIRMVHEAAEALGNQFKWNISPPIKQNTELLQIEFVNNAKDRCVHPIELIEPSPKTENDKTYFDRPVMSIIAGLPKMLKLRALVLDDNRLQNKKLRAKVVYPDGTNTFTELNVLETKIRQKVKIFCKRPWTNAAFIDISIGYLERDQFVKASASAKLLVQAVK